MTEQQTGAAEASPCVGICAVDEAGERCLGCHRTLPEIAAWSRMTTDDQRLLKEDLAVRALRAEKEGEVN